MQKRIDAHEQPTWLLSEVQAATETGAAKTINATRLAAAGHAIYAVDMGSTARGD